MIELNDLLLKAGLDPARVVVMRHRPTSRELREQLPWMAAERPELFNAFQSSHSRPAEAMLKKAMHLVSLIGDRPGKALFVSVYDVASYRMISPTEFASMEVNQALLPLGTNEPEANRISAWFDLRPSTTLAELKGRLVLQWTPPERAWSRWAGNGRFLVDSIHEESRLVSDMPAYSDLVLPYQRLGALPPSWRNKMSQWRGIYYIFDTASCKGYVGSAYGRENILARWEEYGATGHGGNQLLRKCTPDDLRFSILQLVEPDMGSDDVIAIEQRWKMRLNTRAPYGLNAN